MSKKPKLTPRQQLLLAYLKKHGTGNEFTEQEVLEATRWSASTFRTYLAKNYLAPFIATSGERRFRVLMDGSSITEEAIASAFTQVKAAGFVPTAGEVMTGEGGQYTLISRIGVGAVGQVWKANCRANSSAVAVKMFLPREEYIDSRSIDSVRERFVREARFGARIDSPFVVRVLDNGIHKGTPFMVMSLAKKCLAEKLSESGPCPPAQAGKIILDVSCGLECLHEMDCVHRDIKPSNILEIDNQYALGDLGVVSWSSINPAFTTAGTLTRGSIQIGSFLYMAPEQRLRKWKQITPAADISSLALIRRTRSSSCLTFADIFVAMVVFLLHCSSIYMLL